MSIITNPPGLLAGLNLDVMRKIPASVDYVTDHDFGDEEPTKPELTDHPQLKSDYLIAMDATPDAQRAAQLATEVVRLQREVGRLNDEVTRYRTLMHSFQSLIAEVLR